MEQKVKIFQFPPNIPECFQTFCLQYQLCVACTWFEPKYENIVSWFSGNLVFFKILAKITFFEKMKILNVLLFVKIL